MILLYIHHTFEMKFKLRGYLLFQSCQEGGVRLPVRRADQLRDAREEADPLRDEHAHSGPHSAAERPRQQEVSREQAQARDDCGRAVSKVQENPLQPRGASATCG